LPPRAPELTALCGPTPQVGFSLLRRPGPLAVQKLASHSLVAFTISRSGSGVANLTRIGDCDDHLTAGPLRHHTPRHQPACAAAVRTTVAMSLQATVAYGPPQRLAISRSFQTYFDVNTEPPMITAKVFRAGDSEAVRLPKQFRLRGEEAEIFRRGDEIVLGEKTKDLTRAFQLLYHLPDCDRENTPPEERGGFGSSCPATASSLGLAWM
jgi:antitoxin VapB